ncbi:MAG: pyroglutamyl-peptidase I [Planctomycetota bacterium]
MKIISRVLLTGFEPFGNFVKNSSYESIKTLHDKKINNAKIVVKSLPVSYNSAGKLLEHYILESRPQIVISFGMGTKFIQFEWIALNINYSTRKDNDGTIIKKEETIKEDGPLAYKSRLPFRKIADTLKKHDIPFVQSFFAGTYLCNNIFYHLLYYAQKYQILLAGFIHLPPTPECFKNHPPIREKSNTTSKLRPTYSCINYPTITLANLRRAIKLIVKTCIEFAL